VDDEGVAPVLLEAANAIPFINLQTRTVNVPPVAGSLYGIDTENLSMLQPRALAAGDFDRDGISDLVIGYSTEQGGRLILGLSRGGGPLRKNSGARNLGVNDAFAGVRPREFSLPIEVPFDPEFLGVGDFDADGQLDVVASSTDATTLEYLRGDGRGKLVFGSYIELGGRVTALITGDINRRDGLADILVGLVTPYDGPQLLVFEAPAGALRGAPETFDLPAEATALAMGQLDDQYPLDIAIGAGRTLLVIYGRDRCLSLDDRLKSEVLPARTERLTFRERIHSIAIGDFVWDNTPDMAILLEGGLVEVLSTPVSTSGANSVVARVDLHVLGVGDALLASTRTSSLPGEDLLVLDRAGHDLHIVMPFSKEPRRTNPESRRWLGTASPHVPYFSLDLGAGAVVVLPMRLNHDALDDLLVLRSGHEPLLEAVTSPLAAFSVTNTDDSGPGSLRQAILDANANPGFDLISFGIPGPGSHTIRPLTVFPPVTDPVAIDGTTQPGYVTTPLIEVDGSAALGGGTSLLTITAGDSILWGLAINSFGASGTARTEAVLLETNGNNSLGTIYLGTDPSGALARGNYIGVRIRDSAGNRIGRASDSAPSLIADNTAGIIIEGSLSTGNIISEVQIGGDSAGLLPNRVGISIKDAPGNAIGEFNYAPIFAAP